MRQQFVLCVYFSSVFSEHIIILRNVDTLFYSLRVQPCYCNEDHIIEQEKHTGFYKRFLQRSGPVLDNSGRMDKFLKWQPMLLIRV